MNVERYGVLFGRLRISDGALVVEEQTKAAAMATNELHAVDKVNGWGSVPEPIPITPCGFTAFVIEPDTVAIAWRMPDDDDELTIEVER